MPTKPIQGDTSAMPELSMPPEEALGTVAWANQAAALLVYRVWHDTKLPFLAKARMVSDLIGKIGMTHGKAITEERVKRLEKQLGVGREALMNEDGLEPDPEKPRKNGHAS